MSDFMGKLITGLITALATLIVCFVNNYFQNKRERAALDLKTKEHFEEMQQMYLNEIASIKQDYSAQITALTGIITELKHDISEMAIKTEYQFDKIDAKVDTLSERQARYNNLQERTMKCETALEVQAEQIKHIEKDVKGV